MLYFQRKRVKNESVSMIRSESLLQGDDQSIHATQRKKVLGDKVYGKKGERSEDIADIINNVPNREFCSQMKERIIKYRKENSREKQARLGYSAYRINKAYEMRNTRNLS